MNKVGEDKVGEDKIFEKDIILKLGKIKPTKNDIREVIINDVEEKGKLKKSVIFMIILLVIIMLGFLYYFFDYFPKKCNDVDCYQKALVNCKKSFYINEEEDYVWRYDIMSKNDISSCNVKVRMLKIKKGDIKLDDFVDKEMICIVQKYDYIYPEKDMLRCTGNLKEELQEIVIDRLHNYILQNLEKINEKLLGV